MILVYTAYLNRMEKNKFSPGESDMIDNNLYKTNSTQEKGKDTKDSTETSFYADIPATTTTQPQSSIYDGLAPPTPSHTVKQSDNPLYSSTQELRMSTTYDTIPSRGRSRTPSDVPPKVPNPNTISSGKATTPFKDMPQDSGSVTPTGNNIINNRLSYGLELELSNREIPPVHHQRSLSQGVDPVYTEL